MPWEEGRSSASGNLEDFLAEETFRLGLGGGRQGLLSRERKHQEEIASVGEKLGSTPPHIPLATTSHMTAVGAREAGKCSLRLGSPFLLTVCIIEGRASVFWKQFTCHPATL